MQSIICLSASHKRAPVRVLESYMIEDIAESLRELRSLGASECAIVQTCHRVEIYVVGGFDGCHLMDYLRTSSGSPYPVELHSDIFSGEEAVRHLIYLASGLESVIVGENEILHQVEESLKIAEGCGAAGDVLRLLFRSAINAGRRVRRETQICRGSISIGNLVIKAIIQELGTLEGKKLVIIGAGRIGSLIAKSLPKKGPATVFIANRTQPRAERLAAEVSGKAVRFDSLRELLSQADAVVCATSSPHLVLTKEDFASIGGNRRHFVIDVSNPRGVDERIKDLENVRLIDLDKLTKMARENLKVRQEAIESARAIADSSLKALVERLSSKERAVRLAEMMRWAEERRRRSIDVALRKAHFSEDQKRVMEEFSYALMRDLLVPLSEGRFAIGGDRHGK